MTESKFDVTEIFSCDELITGVFRHKTQLIFATDTGVHIVTEGRWKKYLWSYCQAIAFPPNDHIVLIGLRSGKVVAYEPLIDYEISFQCIAEDICHSFAGVFIQSGNIIHEVAFTKDYKCAPILQPVARIVENQTKLYPGCYVQYDKGVCSVGLFDKDCTVRMRMPNLEYGQVVSAKYEKNVFMATVVEDQEKQRSRYVSRFTENLEKYDITINPNVKSCPVNFTVLDNGVCTCINEDNSIELCRNRYHGKARVLLYDPAVDVSAKLCNDGQQVLFVRGSKVYHITMKEKS